MFSHKGCGANAGPHYALAPVVFIVSSLQPMFAESFKNVARTADQLKPSRAFVGRIAGADYSLEENSYESNGCDVFWRMGRDCPRLQNINGLAWLTDAKCQFESQRLFSVVANLRPPP